ncbi:MAG: DUF2605 family protein [Synechococcaceae cyanobacterium]|nr:DUF2605 family protein [Synechococcaceae cyanobacterium]
MDPAASASQPREPGEGALLEQLLGPLLEDFATSFSRGLELLEQCPDRVMEPERRQRFRSRLLQARAELAAARALRAAAPTPMALEMATISPWHALLVEVWSLSAALRAADAHPDDASPAPGGPTPTP